jgi:hypothetical protein
MPSLGCICLLIIYVKNATCLLSAVFVSGFCVKYIPMPVVRVYLQTVIVYLCDKYSFPIVRLYFPFLLLGCIFLSYC